MDRLQPSVATGSHIERELASQPDVWQQVTDHLDDHAAVLPGRGERVAAVGCGTSLYMARAYAALREAAGQGETDAFPAADVGLLRAMAGEFGHRPSPAALLVRAESWRPWRAYAALHLWASLPVAPAVIRQERPDDQRAA